MPKSPPHGLSDGCLLAIHCWSSSTNSFVFTRISFASVSLATKVLLINYVSLTTASVEVIAVRVCGFTNRECNDIKRNPVVPSAYDEVASTRNRHFASCSAALYAVENAGLLIRYPGMPRPNRGQQQRAVCPIPQSKRTLSARAQLHFPAKLAWCVGSSSMRTILE